MKELGDIREEQYNEKFRVADQRDAEFKRYLVVNPNIISHSFNPIS